MIDLAFTTAPTIVGGRDTPDMAHGVTVDEDHVYIADEETGLLVVPLQCEPVESIREMSAAAALRMHVWPNPTSTAATILLDLARSNPAEVAVHDMTGRRVCQLMQGRLPAGTHRLQWRGRDGHGRLVPAGHYWIRISTAGGTWAERLVVVR